MTLAEALIQRATLQTRIGELQRRIAQNALVQEGADPSEDPNALLREVDEALDQLETLIKRINGTNSRSTLPDGRTLTHALADRDIVAKRARTYRAAAEAGTPNQQRYSSSELRNVSVVDVAALQRRADDLARQHRDLDSQIQAANWATLLIEE